MNEIDVPTGIRQAAAERVIVQTLAAMVQVGTQSEVPPEAIARALVEEARKLVGDDAVVDLVRRQQ